MLAAVLIFCACVPAFAQDESKTSPALQPAGGYPVIVVRGMDFTGLYIDYGTEKQHNCMGDINVGGILKAVGSALLTKLFKNDRKAATHILIEELEKIFGGYACNEDGSSKYNVGTEKLPGAIGNYPEFFDRVDYEFGITRTAAEKFGGDMVYYFNYDWRLDPMQTADEINGLHGQQKTVGVFGVDFCGDPQLKAVCDQQLSIHQNALRRSRSPRRDHVF